MDSCAHKLDYSPDRDAEWRPLTLSSRREGVVSTPMDVTEVEIGSWEEFGIGAPF